MLVLCSNDDGILARGLECLERAAQPLGDVFVVAPDREQSATSHALTLHHPLRPVQLGPNRWQVDGTPTDCVMLAIEALMPVRPKFVLSGINHGPNMGEDVLYSGTVAAAMEGFLLGIPSIAFSLSEKGYENLESAAHFARQVLARYIDRPLSGPTLLNVNFPSLPRAEVKGVLATRLGRRHKAEPAIKAASPHGETVYWVGPAGPAADDGPGTDFHAVAQGHVSVTPLQIDLTHFEQVHHVRTWLGQ